MTRKDPGAATGTIPVEPGRCACKHLEVFHNLGRRGRTGCDSHGCGCLAYDEMPTSNVVPFPGASRELALGPPVVVDLDGVGDRYTELCEARAAGNTTKAALLAAACADDIPALQALISRLQRALRGESDGS
ncbi:hypothetical protein [Micromonospora sp. NPDC004704]